MPTLIDEQRRHAHVAGADAARALARASARAGPRCSQLEAIYVGGSRIPSAVFERALDLVGPRIGVLYGMTEAPICCYLPPQELAGEATAAG